MTAKVSRRTWESLRLFGGFTDVPSAGCGVLLGAPWRATECMLRVRKADGMRGGQRAGF